LYKHVLQLDLPWLGNVVRASRPKRLPLVLTRSEVRRILAELEEPYLLIASLLYGSGLRVLEALRLRVKDVDLEHRTLVVRDGKGAKDRITVLPESRSRFAGSLPTCERGMNTHAPTGSPAWKCPMPWRGNTRAPTWNSAGSTFFRRLARRWIRAPANGDGITSFSIRSSET
jgi:integrase